MENNNTPKPIELSREFWEWLWETDKQTYTLILFGHIELIEKKQEEYKQYIADKEKEKEKNEGRTESNDICST